MWSRKSLLDNPLLFNYETTTRTDLQNRQIDPIMKTVYKPKPLAKHTSHKVKSARLKHTECFAEWKVPPNSIPLELLTKPKEIIRTDPRNMQKRFDKIPNPDLEQVRKTRPRLLMSPAMCIDDVDPEQLEYLKKDIYTTETMKMQREGYLKINNVISAWPGAPAPSKPITLRNQIFPYVSPEWRMDSVTWDRRHPRIFCDPQQLFWSRRTPKYTVDSKADRQRRKMVGQKQ